VTLRLSRVQEVLEYIFSRFSEIQGGALNRGLLFADPPLSLLGAVSGNISEIR
jgi:hypothetical protein